MEWKFYWNGRLEKFVLLKLFGLIDEKLIKISIDWSDKAYYKLESIESKT